MVVWRRPRASVSPKVSSHHHKPGGSKRHSGSKKRQEGLKHSVHRNPTPRPGDEDDVPPGFGPPVAKDDDDLPEFDFSGGGRSSHRAAVGGNALRAAAPPPALPSDHMRELIQKYGQGEGAVKELGIPVEPWNDDDDIPEWNPNQNPNSMPPRSVSLSSPLPPPQVQAYQQPFAVNPNLMPPQFVKTPLPPPIRPHVGGLRPNNNTMWWPTMVRGVAVRGLRPPGRGMGPRMVQGFGGVRSGLGFWRPDNNPANKGL